MRNTPRDDDPDSNNDPTAELPSQAGPGNSGKKRSFWQRLPVVILTALVLSFLLQTFVARVYLIPSESMEPTLHGCAECTGDRIVVDKLVYRFSDARPGDVVVFKGPASWNTRYVSNRSANPVLRTGEIFLSSFGLAPPDENDLVKRVIATGGQTVQCRNSEGGVTVDGHLLIEPYLDNPQMRVAASTNPCLGPEFGPTVIPEDAVWVMGDNRTNSADSRYHQTDPYLGAVPMDNIIGKVRAIILPPRRWGMVSSPEIQSE
ncbi:signal peptidase I [Rhodococcus erythropolis]|uniref:signal peptidase I n=1 Tax=Rhodococcus erythropolis TaxID=1833 RepID=UPI0029498A34|nr:signal peptidase I [Rhodococcus erythropolis]MDV6278153.1 signal peptidase I [Rhodococcus erythropolis]